WSEPEDRRRWWLLLTGVATGATVWALHMLARLAAATDVPQVYDPGLVLTALLLGSLASVGTIWISVLRLGAVSGYLIGGLLGAISASVHFAGALATHPAGEMHWRLDMVALTYLWAISSSALASSRLSRSHGPSAGYQTMAIYAVSILLLVPLGLTSVEVIPDPARPLPEGMTDAGSLLMLVVALVVMQLVLGVAIFSIDQSATRDARARYRHLALHDPLTGLPNRAYLREALEKAIHGSTDLGARMAVVCVDLDRFKPVNDVHGHIAGDALLRGIADRLRRTLGPGEFVARTGGDEFVAFKTGLGGREDGEEFARRLRAAIAAPVEWEGLELAVDGSAGVAFLPDDAEEAETLLNRADLALYRAKSDPQHPIRLYEGRMDEASRSRSALAMELREALKTGAFELHFQPQTDLATGDVTGFEALVRWRHPDRGLVPPSEFIPVAESTGLIRDLGAWVLREACRTAAAWPRAYRVSVNVSPLQLAQPDYVETVQDALLAAGLDPSALELEVTEASLISDHERLLEVMQALKRLGVKVAMDDYGAGLASLNALRSFPFDRLKIDREFVDGMLSDPQAAAMVEATLLQARALGIPVLAEGVSDETHLAALRRYGCGEAQGYLFGRPMRAEEATELIDRDAARRARPDARADARAAARAAP
ncbi:MAG: EAL domain-containing protein, partial [Pseudomonadota bacterium]|nr:EAL domain-containing protein [Pseudomonadota bacterium]